MHSHSHHGQNKLKNIWLDYKPLIIVVAICLLMSLAQNYSYMLSLNDTMYAFMAYFFIFLAMFKLFDLKGFVEGFRTYDLVAKKNKGYAQMYPFFELFLGLGYLVQNHLCFLNWATLILMAISGYSTYKTVTANRKVKCACLGTMLDVPLSTVSVLENLGMGLMAAYQLIQVSRFM